MLFLGDGGLLFPFNQESSGPSELADLRKEFL